MTAPDLFASSDSDHEPDKPSSDPFQLPQADGYVVRWNAAFRGYEITVPDGELIYVESFFNLRISNRSLEYFQENDQVDWQTTDWPTLSPEAFARIAFTNIRWRQDRIRLYGKERPLPRLTAWYGDDARSYTYSGITSRPNPWNKGLLYLKERVEALAGTGFNSVLLNWYRDGNDHLGWHADDEKELGRDPVIASVNFGETRDFFVRRKDDHRKKLVLPLKHGSLLLMRGALQHHWEHSVPKRARVKTSRFNLTFRQIGG